MDEWINYLKNTNEDVFEIIKNLIKIAAIDHPNEFREKRDKLAEELFTRDMISASRVNKEDNGVAEVLTIKGVLEKSGMHESGEVVCDLLKKLRDMRLSFKTLEATRIGITVNALKKHESKDVKQTAKVMIRDWKRMVDEYLDGDGKKSVVVQEEEECGELNKNNVKPVNGNDLVVVLMSEQQTRNIVRQKLKEAQVTEKDNVQSKGPVNDNEGVAEVSRTTGLVNERKREDESKSESRSVLLESSRKPRELNRNMKLQTGSEKAKDQKGPVSLDQQRKKAMNVEAATSKNQKVSTANFDEKLEAAKRKFQQGYKEEELMKKKRRVQVLEYHELTKHGILPPKDQRVENALMPVAD
ncbi:transcription elongation factor TFIIS/CRSP70 [Tanacetum coccineum]